MKKAIIKPSFLHGEITLPPSKSAAHRAIICAALCKGKSTIKPVSMSKDMLATIGAVREMGAQVDIDGDTLIIDGTNIFSKKTCRVNCIESGSTLRFIIPICAVGGVETTFVGEGRLPQRPIGDYLRLLPENGCECDSEGGLPLKITGKLKAGRYELAGNISSQYITGLLLALAITDGESEIVLTTPLESVGYVNMTIDVMRKFGVNIITTENGYIIHGNQEYKPCDFYVESDWSQAGFFLCCAAIGAGELAVNGLDGNSLQGDRQIAEIFTQMGADIKSQNGKITAKKGANLQSIKLDVSQIPDLVPCIAAACACADGESEIYGGARLRIKESDRITSTVNMLKSFGVNAEERSDGMKIYPCGEIKNVCEVDGCNDHRIVMAAAMLALVSENETHITYADSVNKSYPDFWEEYNRLGGKANVINVGQ